MALFNKLKGVADKAKEVAAKTVAAATEMAAQAKEKGEQEKLAAQQAEEARKATAEEEYQKTLEECTTRIVDAYMKSSMDEYKILMDAYKETADEDAYFELLALLDEKEIEKCNDLISQIAKKPDCDLGKGDCGWLGHSFYCTCAENAECPRKTYVPTEEKGKLISPEHLPYIKFIASFYPDCNPKMIDENTGIRLLTAFRLFFAKFLPEHLPATWGDPGLRFAAFMLAHGMGSENIVMDILFSIHNQTDGKIVPPIDFLISTYEDIINSENESDYLNITLPFFKNPSLYDRSREDLEYTATMLDIVSSPTKRVAASLTSDEVSLNKLFNEDGTIKEAGIGGPRKGFYGDEIYNIVGSWISKEG